MTLTRWFNRRAILKCLHWITLGLLLYFYFVEPHENERDPGAAVTTHSGMALLLMGVTAIWLGIYLLRGPAGRAGPKLPPWARRIYPAMHKALQYAVPVMLGTGVLMALTAPYVIEAFGVLQINPGFGTKFLHRWAFRLHELTFDLLIIVIAAHTAFHLWRHFLLKDNALRIMAPKALHRYLK